MKKTFKNIVALVMLTVTCVLSCQGALVFASNIDIAQLQEDYAELKEENKRMTNMISQYQIAIRGLQGENYKLTTELSKYKEAQSKKYLGEFTITHYCTEKYAHICGNGENTASRTQVTAGRTVAVDPKVIPYGTKLYIEGYGYRIAEDTGGAITNNKIDIAVETHDEANKLGTKRGVKVWIVEE